MPGYKPAAFSPEPYPSVFPLTKRIERYASLSFATLKCPKLSDSGGLQHNLYRKIDPTVTTVCSGPLSTQTTTKKPGRNPGCCAVRLGWGQCPPEIILLPPIKEALQKQQYKPCPSPEVEFCLRENYRSRAGLGIEAPTIYSQSPYQPCRMQNSKRKIKAEKIAPRGSSLCAVWDM